MGVTDLFDPKSANLSGISNKLGLAIGSVVQKAFINVTEAGIEAAAATDSKSNHTYDFTGLRSTCVKVGILSFFVKRIIFVKNPII